MIGHKQHLSPTHLGSLRVTITYQKISELSLKPCSFFFGGISKSQQKAMFVGVKVFFFPFILDDSWIFRKKKYIRLRNCNLVVQNCTADAARIGHLAASPAAWAITIASALWLRPSQASQGIRVLEKRFATPCVYIHVYIYIYVYTHTHIVYIYKNADQQ